MSNTSLIPNEKIERAIYLIRGEKVMLDRDLAALYGVATTRFLSRPSGVTLIDFPMISCLCLARLSLKNWRSQFVTSKGDRKGLRYAPFAFTEHGILMLSSVLTSETRDPSQHRNHASLCKAPTDARL